MKGQLSPDNLKVLAFLLLVGIAFIAGGVVSKSSFFVVLGLGALGLALVVLLAMLYEEHKKNQA